MQETLTSQNKVKLYFLVKKKVNYGSALYVVGDLGVLGAWDIRHALRLNWNTDDYWSGFVEIQLRAAGGRAGQRELNRDHGGQQGREASLAVQSERIFYKYAIAPYNDPSPPQTQWQQGGYNRQLLLGREQQNIIIQNIWNANKISLNLLVPKHIIKADTEIYLAGGCNQLGNWRNRLKMERMGMEGLSQGQIGKARESIVIQDYQLFSVTLSVQRNLRCFNYYFIKKTGNEWQPDRIPQREFKIDRAENHHPTCLHISTKTNNYELLELSKFAQLYYSKITDQIYIGGCIETIDDVKELKKRGINAIVYLAASGAGTGSKNLIRMISQENKIEYFTVKIELQRESTLLQEAKEALELLAYILETEEKIVYLYCSTGTLLSPLLTALYLYIEGKFFLKKALEYVKEKHPISAIDQRIMMLASEISQEKIFQREVKKEENVREKVEDRKMRQMQELRNKDRDMEREREREREREMQLKNQGFKIQQPAVNSNQKKQNQLGDRL